MEIPSDGALKRLLIASLFLLGFYGLTLKENQFIESQFDYRPQNCHYPQIHTAYVEGNKHILCQNLREAHRRLNLMHLLTPSGLHLKVYLYPLKILKRIPPLKSILIIAIFLYLFCLDEFYSLKRMSLFYVLSLIKVRSFKIPTEPLFWLTFLTDFILGNFQKSPLSFIYSMIFWGIILFAEDHFWIRGFYLWFAQNTLHLMLSSGFTGGIHPLVILIQIPLTAIFFPFFLICIASYFSSFILKLFSSLLVYYQQFLLSILGHVAYLSFHPTETIFLFMFARNSVLFYIILLIQTEQLHLPMRPGKLSIHDMPKKTYPITQEYFQDGIKLRYANGVYCRLKLRVRDDQWRGFCKKKPSVLK